MIVKELEPLETTDPLAHSGRRAEEQMAHYLRRAFGDAPDVLVFHGLRLERDGDAAQMDHLLLHRHGAIIVESKSVSTQVEVNDHGEWSRTFRGQRRGMPSPVEQARRQSEFLRAYLQESREQLRGTYLLGIVQGGFRNMPLDLLVAISDDGIIRRPRRLELHEVLKADQVSSRIHEILKEYRRVNSLFNLRMDETGYEFRRDELERIVRFLAENHRPLTRSAPTSAVSSCATPVPAHASTSAPVLDLVDVGGVRTSPTASAASSVKALGPAAKQEQVCRSCHGRQLSVEWGRYGYYFKCAECQGNTPIREACSACGEREKIRKSGPQFFAECAECSASRLFYTNT